MRGLAAAHRHYDSSPELRERLLASPSFTSEALANLPDATAILVTAAILGGDADTLLSTLKHQCATYVDESVAMVRKYTPSCTDDEGALARLVKLHGAAA